MRKVTIRLLFITLALLVIPSPVVADNIVVNPGFESGSDGWVMPGFGVYSDASASGSFSAVTGCVGHGCMGQYGGAYLKQVVNTQPGQTYTLSFWVAESGGATSEMAVYWDGNLISDIVNPANNSCALWYDEEFGGMDSSCVFVQYTFAGLVASSTETVLQVNGRQDPSGIFFDDFVVTDGTTSAAPEPESMVLLSSGLLGSMLAFAIWRVRDNTPAPRRHFRSRDNVQMCLILIGRGERI